MYYIFEVYDALEELKKYLPKAQVDKVNEIEDFFDRYLDDQYFNWREWPEELKEE